MAAPRRRNRTGESKREEIRRAAYDCFRAGGFHATSVDDICAAAGASKGSFYWHYASKQEVFVDILETWTREVMDQLYEQFEEAVIDADYVAAITEALKREVKRGRVIVPLWLEFIAQGSREPELQAAVSKFHRRARSAIASILRPAVAGRCSEGELQAIAATIFGAYLGLVVQDGADPERAHAVDNVSMFMALLGRLFQYLPHVAPDAPVQ
ncbi:MAG: TetR/AcrR family transcriptional regulator [Myxococcales bacterium]|nr:TetR/AcrR family transcriptional regulator [Myxococcales bacterium]MCB9547775.1 TetR/AcrR family transcriptional regulator [Myxococcales bacterium]